MRVERFAVCFFKLTYFLGSTSAGFYLFWNREWFPSILGGQAESFRPLYEAYPFVPITDGVILYYMCQLAYHTHSLVYQFAKSKRNDFLEMIIHHVCAIFLVLFSYFNGFHRVGCAVYFLHDLADVWAYAVKSTVDTDYIALVLSCYFSLLGSWGYLRLYALPLMTLNLPVFWDCLATSTVYQYAPNLGNIFSIQVAMLYILIALHYMWYGLFLQIGYTFFCKGIKEDTQAKIVVTEEEERVCKGEEEQKDGDKEPSKQKTAGLGELRQRLQQNVN